MLENLTINNVAVIEAADIFFAGGLNVLTGETGAGKSIIIDSLNAVLGERTSRDLIRTGCDKASVTALFSGVDDPEISSLLEEMGVETEEDGSLVISRTISADGKNTCRVNGAPVTVSMIKKLGCLLINIHGQHDSQSLLNSRSHLGFVDAYGGLGGLLEEYRSAYTAWKACKKKLDLAQTDDRERERRLEILEYQMEEIEKAQLTPGETEELKAKREFYRNSEKVAAAVRRAHGLLTGDDESDGALLGVKEAADELSDAAEYFREAEETAGELEELSYRLEDIADTVSSLLDSLDFDPEQAEQVEERYDLLHKLSRKYGGDEEEILAFYDKCAEEAEQLSSYDDMIERLTAEEKELLSKAGDLAGKLSQKRKAAAERFASAVCSELEYLDMPNVRFIVGTEESALGESGKDDVEFLISANVGEEPKPLSKIASGGELSRIMLSIKNVLSEKDSVRTLVFDEVDTGVSGRAALKLGNKLRQVSAGRQVLCVTHLAQIAAKADHHCKIEKTVSGGKTYTSVIPLDLEGRKNELARILSGDTVTRAQLDLAEELLNS